MIIEEFKRIVRSFSPGRKDIYMADSWADITAWFAEDPNLSWIKDEIVNFDVGSEMLASWEQAVRYQGFDVKILLKKLRASYIK